MVNVRLDHRAIGANLSPCLDSPESGVTQQLLVDPLPRLRSDTLDVLLQRRLLGGRLVDAESTEGAVAARVREMERKLLVAEAVHLFDDQGAQHLLGRQPFASLVRVDALGGTPKQIVAYPT